MNLRHLALTAALTLGMTAAMLSADDKQATSGLLANGNFTPGATGNLPHWSPGLLKARPMEENNGKFCRLTLPADKTNGWFSSSNIPLKPGKEYYFAFKVRKQGECRLIPFIVAFKRNTPKKENIAISFFTAQDGIRDMPEWTEFFGTVKVPEKSAADTGFVHFYVDRNQENTVKFASKEARQIDLAEVQLREL